MMMVMMMMMMMMMMMLMLLMMMVMMLAPHVLWRMFKMCVFCYFISRTFVSKDNCVCGLNENGWKRLIGQRLRNIPANDKLRLPESFLFCMMERVPGGMFWAKVAHFGPPGTPRKSAFFYERGRKRMKEWRQVTFMKEWVKALDDTRILAPADLR